MHERTPLIASIFSDRSGVEVIGHLSGDDAQAFINVMYEVSIYTLTSEEWAYRLPLIPLCPVG